MAVKPETTTDLASIVHNTMHWRGHRETVYCFPLKILEKTIFRGFPKRVMIECKCGRSLSDDLVDNIYRNSPLLKKLMEKANAKR